MVSRAREKTTMTSRVAELEAALAAVTSERAALTLELESSKERIAQLENERDALRQSHARLREELELLKKRLFVAKAERVDTKQLEIEFAAKMRELEKVAGTLGMGKHDGTAEASSDDAPPSPKSPRRKPTGRRDLRSLPLEEERIEVTDPVLEQLVIEGKAVRHGFDESVSLKRKRGGMRRVVVARAKYRSTDTVNDETGAMAVYTTSMPPVMFGRSIATPSLVAHIASRKVTEGMPLFRIEDSFLREGIPIHRALMSRWLAQAGETFGSTVVYAMRKHALSTAFCIATDATGLAVQPVRTHEKQRQACKKGHFLVQIADRDHIFFEYLERETGAAISEAFRGFSGYVQADAKSVFNPLFEPPHECDDGCDRKEIGCWSHARRKFWEATVAKSATAREGLRRIGRIFDLDATWKGKPPAEIKRLRDVHLHPHVDAFFAWVDAEYEIVRHQRGLLNAALGYAHRQKPALTRFLDDGRLVLDNNRSERALRSVAVGRKAWLFAGSDDHAASISHIFTLVASARLHGLDPEEYLRDVIRVLPHWPADRYLELAPLFWKVTRARLDPIQLEAEIGPLTIPAPLPPRDATEQQAPG